MLRRRVSKAATGCTIDVLSHGGISYKSFSEGRLSHISNDEDAVGSARMCCPYNWSQGLEFLGRLLFEPDARPRLHF